MENTSQISSDELKEQKKKRRRIKARKCVSSSSEEDVLLTEDKENRNIQANQLLPTLPQIEHFMPNNKSQVTKVIENVGRRASGKTNSTNRININGKQYILFMIMDTKDN